MEELTHKAIEVVREAGQFIGSKLGKVSGNEIESKERHSLVSYVDKTAEKILVEGLGKLLPDAVFLTEEDTVENSQGKYRWIIDPLDGTTNFLHQIPLFTVSVALEIDGMIRIGVVYEPMRDEMFSAWKSGGAFLNDNEIGISQQEKYEDALIITGFPYTLEPGVLDDIMSSLRTFTEQTRGVRRLGSAALDLAYVACGRADAFYEPLLSAWDVAGGSIIVQEAGGRVTDFKNGDNYIFGGQILASNGHLHMPIQKVIDASFSS